ncbi:MAG: pdhR 1, partial [Phenylobacterium sp.]|nr:pdhR 1 [Phenylobacterium sp.]
MAEHSAITAAKLKLTPARGPQPKSSEAPPLRVPRAAELVADHIRSMIIRGELAPGDRLQPEAELIERFGTSRATIREAML